MNLLDLIFPKKCLECGKVGKYICDNCIKKITPARCEGNNYSIFKYEGVTRKVIISLKYKFSFDVADELVEKLVLEIKKSNFKLNDIILVPIPLHYKRENWRGFNQSELIGEKLAKEMNWKYIPDLLIRQIQTVPQVGLKGLARRQNLSGVFIINQKYSSLLTVHDSLLLFDDVYTTGSTINEAKKVLEKEGFKKIYSLTIAR